MRAVGAACATMASLTRSSTSNTLAAWMDFNALMVSKSGSPGPAPTRVQRPAGREKGEWFMARTPSGAGRRWDRYRRGFERLHDLHNIGDLSGDRFGHGQFARNDTARVIGRGRDID